MCSSDLTIGLLVLVRIGWRLTHRPPPLPQGMPRWQQLAASVSHGMLYLSMVVMPVSGYLGSSFTKYPIKYFGTTLPHWGWEDAGLKELCSQVHWAAVLIFMALIALHAAAGLKHLLVDRDGVFQRMWFGGAAR